VSGMKVPSEDDESPPIVLSTVRKNYADKPFAKEYAPVWDRFFGNGGR